VPLCYSVPPQTPGEALVYDELGSENIGKLKFKTTPENSKDMLLQNNVFVIL